MNLFQHSFSETPVTLDLQRSRFYLKNKHKTSMNQGQLVPIYLSEVIAGDTFSMDMSAFIRMATPVYPVMDDAYIDVAFYFCPMRLLWTHFKEFLGENTSAPWTQTTEYVMPKCRINASQVQTSSLANHFGIPAKFGSGGGYTSLEVNALPFRAYYLIWNNWYMDQNTQYPVNVYLGDNYVAYGSTLTNNFEYAKTILPVCRMADRFSTCLPQPQKGPAVELPLGASAPVRTSNTLIPIDSRYQDHVKFSLTDGSDFPTGFAAGGYVRASDNTKIGLMSVSASDTLTSGQEQGIIPRNLFADLSEATASTVNELRQAFAVQRLLERAAIGGSRMREILKANFGTTIPDATVQIPEYLGGFRQPVNMDQVVQTSSTDSVSPLATTSGVSVTTHVANGVFTKSFVEPGYVIGVSCIRVDHSYSQGIDPLWMRERRYEYYYPALSNIGNQPVFKYELYASDANLSSKDVFGYQEAWSDYRYARNMCTGSFAANVNTSSPAAALQPWIYSDVYSSSPALSDDWMREGSSNVANTLAVTSGPQFLCDFYFKNDAYRPMPLYSVPGLIDHH